MKKKSFEHLAALRLHRGHEAAAAAGAGVGVGAGRVVGGEANTCPLRTPQLRPHPRSATHENEIVVDCEMDSCAVCVSNFVEQKTTKHNSLKGSLLVFKEYFFIKNKIIAERCLLFSVLEGVNGG